MATMDELDLASPTDAPPLRFAGPESDERAFVLPQGVSHALKYMVRRSDLASQHRTAGVASMGTHRIAVLAEDACMQCLARHLPKGVPRGYTTVSVGMDLRHLRPVPLGTDIEVTVSNAAEDDGGDDTGGRQGSSGRRGSDGGVPIPSGGGSSPSPGARAARSLGFRLRVSNRSTGEEIASGSHARAFVLSTAVESRLLRKQAHAGELREGLAASNVNVVDERHTGAYLGTTDEDGGAAQSLSTTALMKWMEGACIMAVNSRLLPGKTTIGGHTSIRHLAPTPRGMIVTCEASLRSVTRVATAKNKLVFDVEARDECEIVARAQHTRFLVDKRAFERAVGPGRRMSLQGNMDDHMAAAEAVAAQAAAQAVIAAGQPRESEGTEDTPRPSDDVLGPPTRRSDGGTPKPPVAERRKSLSEAPLRRSEALDALRNALRIARTDEWTKRCALELESAAPRPGGGAKFAPAAMRALYAPSLERLGLDPGNLTDTVRLANELDAFATRNATAQALMTELREITAPAHVYRYIGEQAGTW